MKYKIFSVRDRAADTYSVPMFLPSVAMAVRSFTDEVNRAADNNMLYRHPDDYDLFLLGSFDDDGANWEVHPPVQLAIGKDVKSV